MPQGRVYLTEDERDLVWRALRFVTNQLANRMPDKASYAIDDFAIGVAYDRVCDVSEKFKPGGAP